MCAGDILEAEGVVVDGAVVITEAEAPSATGAEPAEDDPSAGRDAVAMISAMGTLPN